jgi:esterase/lipase
MIREGMTREPPQRLAPWRWDRAFPHVVGGVLAAWLAPAAAQDIRGMEVCTAEAKMERRTGCLQSNVEFLQQALNKLARETQDKVAAAERDLAAARGEIAALRSTVEKLKSELAEMKAKAGAAAKK